MFRAHRVATVVATVSVLVLAAPVTGAESVGPEKHGWWNRANDQALPLAAPSPPDVPDGGLYVASTLGDVQAIAAVTYRATRPSSLKLTMAGTPSDDPSVVVCAVAASSLNYEPAENGTWQDAPEADCDAAAVKGKVDEEAGTIAFDVSRLARNDTLAVAVVPDGTTRVAFEEPGPQSLTVVAAPAPATTPSPAPVAAQPSPEPAGSGVDPAGPTPTATPTDVGETPAPAPAPAPTPPETGDDPIAVDTATPVSAGTSLPTRAAQGLAIAVGFALLLYYAQGHGILGARYDR